MRSFGVAPDGVFAGSSSAVALGCTDHSAEDRSCTLLLQPDCSAVVISQLRGPSL